MRLKLKHSVLLNQKGSVLLYALAAMSIIPVAITAVNKASLVMKSANKSMQSSSVKQSMFMVRDFIITAAKDVDNDGYYELPKEGVGNSIPATLGTFSPDAYGTAYRYCTWDLGVANGVDGTYSQNFTAPPNAGQIGKLISAGADKTFQTACGDASASGDDVAVDIYQANVANSNGGVSGWSHIEPNVSLLNPLDNVGLGTSTPTHKLELASGTTAAAGIALGDVEVYRSASHTMALSSGNSLNLVSGTIQIGGTTVIDASQNITGANVSGTNMTLTGGSLSMTNGASNTVVMGNGVAAPTTVTRSVGTKFVLASAVGAGTADYAMGIESGALWQSVANSGAVFKWYAASANIMTLDGGGHLGIGTAPNALYSLNTAGAVNASAIYVGGVLMPTVMAGTVAGQTLYWNGTQWAQTSGFTYNSGTGAVNVAAGAIQIGGVSVLDSSRNLVGVNTVAQTLLPSANNTYNLGAAGTQWANVYSNGVYQNGNQVADVFGSATGYVPKFTGLHTLGDSLLYDSGTGVGIGITTPYVSLQVNGTGVIIDNGTNASFGSGIKFNNSGNAHYTAGVNGSSFVIANTSASGNSLWSATPLTLMTLTSTGNALIGTSTDIGSKLNVAGTTTLSNNVAGASGTSGLYIVSADGAAYGLNITPRATLGLYNPIAQLNDTVVKFEQGATDTGGLSLVPYSVTAGGLRINNLGHVGIGTGTQISTLDVNGGVAIGTYAGTAAAPANGLAVSGNTLIGTSSDIGSKLYVMGLSTISNNSTGASSNSAINLVSNDGANYGMTFLPKASVGSYNTIVQANDSVIKFEQNGLDSGGLSLVPHSAGASGLRISNLGSVGIGTGLPGAKLDVRGQADFGVGTASYASPLTTSAIEANLSVNSLITLGESVSGSGNPAITMYRTWAGARTGTANRIFQPSSAGELDFQSGTSNTAYGSETYTTNMAVLANGNILVGAGGDNGVDKLQVNGSITGTVHKSTVATGTAPLVVASTTMVANLNANYLGGQLGSYYLNATNINTGILGTTYGGTGIDGHLAANGTLLIGNGTGYTLATLGGTINQVNVATSAGGITLSLPQNIAQTSTPYFSGLGIGSGATGAPDGVIYLSRASAPTLVLQIAGTTIGQFRGIAANQISLTEAGGGPILTATTDTRNVIISNTPVDNGVDRLQVTGSAYIGANTLLNTTSLTLVSSNTINSYQDIMQAHAAAGSTRIRSYRGGSWDTWLDFMTNSSGAVSDVPTTAMRIASTGSTLLGTVTDDGVHRLQVSGSESITANDSTANPATSASALAITNIYAGAFGSGGALRFNQGNSVDTAFTQGAAIASAYATWNAVNGLGGDLRFYTKNAATDAALQERARFSNVGNLLVGTTTDDGINKLQVNGSLAATTQISVGSNILLSAVSNQIAVKGASSGYMVGRRDTGANAFIMYSDSGALQFYNWNNSSESARISTAGNLIVGTTADNGVDKFQVTGSILASTQIKSAAVISTNYLVALDKAGNNANAGVNLSSITMGKDGTNGMGWIQSYSASAPQATQINPLGGDVLMGTTTDNGSKLQVSGAISAGTAGSTTGTIILQDVYGSGIHLTTLGTDYGSGGPVLGYGVIPSTTTTKSFLSSTTNAGLVRNAINVNGASISFFTGAAQTAAVGAAVAMNERMTILNNGNVGINQTNPLYTLDIGGSINVTGGFYLNGVAFTGGGITPGTVTGQTTYWNGASWQPTSVLRIDAANANIGLNVTPSAWGAGFKALEMGFAGNSVWSAGPNDVRLMNNVYHNGTNYIATNTGYAGMYVQNNGNFVWYTSSASVTAGAAVAGWNQPLTILNTGNVGIGMAAPASRLTVNAYNNVTGTITSLASMGTNNILLDVTGSSLNEKSGIAAKFNGAGIPAAVIFGREGANWGTSVGFYTHNDDAATLDQMAERMHVSANGSVGIGTTTPGYKLDVHGSFRADNGFNLYGGSYNTSYVADGLWGATATPNRVTGTAQGAIVLGYQDNGSGLYGPAYGFEVSHTDGIPMNRTYNAIIMRDREDASIPYYVTNKGGAFFNGNVGFGTTSPQAQLNVAGLSSNNGSPQFLISNGAPATAQELFLGYNTTSDNGYIQSIHQGTAFTPLTINSLGGNVIIGATADNGQKLQVQGAATFNNVSYPTTYTTVLGSAAGAEGELILGNNGLNEIRAGANAAGGYLNFVVNNTGAFGAAATGVLAMQIASNGNVILGSGAPLTGAKLEVTGTLTTTDSVMIKPSAYNGVWLAVKRLDSEAAVYRPFVVGTENTASGYIEMRNGAGTLNTRIATSGLTYFAGGHVAVGTGGDDGSGALLQVAGSVSTGGSVIRMAAGQGYLNGNYTLGGETSTTSGAIYTIGGAYLPTSSTLGTMYGIGYGYSGNSGITATGVPSSNWGMYVASNGTSTIFLDASLGNIYANGTIYSAGVALATANGSNASGTWGINITGNAATVTSISTAQVFSAISGQSNPDWYRTSGTAGWFNSTYSVGIYATQAGRVDLYNGASLYVPSTITAVGAITAPSFVGTATSATYAP